MNLKHSEKISGIKKTIDMLLEEHDKAMAVSDWELAINISYLIEEQLEQLDDNVIQINFV
jgi:hypothetical protein